MKRIQLIALLILLISSTAMAQIKIEIRGRKNAIKWELIEKEVVRLLEMEIEWIPENENSADIYVHVRPKVFPNIPKYTMGLCVSEKQVYVLVPNIKKVLGYYKINEDSPKIWHELALGISKVMAHEIRHALEGTGAHEDQGLMNSSFTRKYLLKVER